jgi:HD-GYP domain-containing protein (c-di-GMP phosphodiesterase class II)
VRIGPRRPGKPKPKAPQRWVAHPVQSMILRGLVLVVPLAAGVATGVAVSRVLPRPDGAAAVGWWALLFVASITVTEIMGRILRRLLPLAVLLKLTLIFPDRAPSRFAMARRVGSIRNLEERVRHAKEHGVEDDPSRAAETILTLVAALSAHDRRTRGHSERVRAFADLLADAITLPQDARDRLRWSALLHDIGKLEVPSRILNKPGKPDPHEWETLQRHPSEGARLAAPLLPWLGEWGLAIEHHHERFDGNGYPHGLAGAEISMGGRILAVADSFETMTAARSYKKPMSVSAARKELARCAGSQFDPTMVRAFLNVSLGRLWRTTGPASWVAQVPLVGAGAQAARTVTAAATKAAVGVAALGASGVVPMAARGQAPVRPALVEMAVTASDHAAQDRGPRQGGPAGGEDGGAEDGRDAGPGETGTGSEGPGGAEGSGGGDTAGPEGGDGGTGGEGGGNGGGGGGLGGAVDNVTDTGGNAVDHVTDTVDNVVGGGAGDAVDDVVGGVGDAVDDVVGGVGGAVGGAVGGLGGGLP